METLSWDWMGEMAEAEDNLLPVELTPQEVCRIAKAMPGDPLLDKLFVALREEGHYREVVA